MDLLSASVEENLYNEPGIVHRLDDAYFKKIDAIEFAVKHDDGKDPKGYLKLILFFTWYFENFKDTIISVFSA